MCQERLTVLSAIGLIAFFCCSVSNALTGKVRDAENVVVEGVGFGKVALGATVDEILQVLGPPEQRTDAPHVWLVYRKSKGIDVISPGGKAKEIRFNPGFQFPLKRGPGIGTPLQEVLEVYGAPLKTVETSQAGFEDRVLYQLPKASKIAYQKEGVLFWFDGNAKVSQFVVFPKQGDVAPPAPPPGPPIPPDADAKEKLKRKVTLVPPYPESYKGAPTDKLSVQYAVIEILKQVGLQYNWQQSFQNTDPVCRKWVTPSIRDMPCADALKAILGPVGLSYVFRDGEVVLTRP